jgi:hypothetical protein
LPFFPPGVTLQGNLHLSRAYTMQTDLSLPPGQDIDTKMLKVARGIAQDIYPAEEILKMVGVSGNQYEEMKRHPRFQGYLISEREAWLSAGNIEERTKLKAGIVLETWMDGAYLEMTNKANALNQRVELGKMLAKIAGFGEPKSFIQTGGGGSGPGFLLQINIGPGVDPSVRHETITIKPEVTNVGGVCPHHPWSGRFGKVNRLPDGNHPSRPRAETRA